MTDLIGIMSEATMKACAAHAADKGLTPDANKACTAMRAIMLAEWTEFKSTLKDALDSHMGDAMYKQIMNVYANSWAVKALKVS